MMIVNNFDDILIYKHIHKPDSLLFVVFGFKFSKIYVEYFIDYFTFILFWRRKNRHIPGQLL